MKFFSKTMKLNNIDTVPYLTYNSLSEINFINHAFTTRLGGVSTGAFSEASAIFTATFPTFVRAVTSAEKGIGIYKPRDMESVDALITNEKGVTLVTYYADCTPLFFVDTKNKAIGLAHAGWRGTVGRIGEKVVEKMTELYGTNPADIKAAIGPAISVCCYEVDYPCAEHFLNLADLDSSKFVFEKGNGKYMVDLLETNRQILTASGVKNENITVSDVCTNCNSDLLWSHRATKGHRGTMSAFMCIK